MHIKPSYFSPNDVSLPPDLAGVFDYWRQKRGRNFAPSFGEFRLDELDTGILPFCVVIDIIAEPADFKFRFFGTKCVLLHRRDFTHHSVSELIPSEIGKKVEQEIKMVLDNQAPVFVTNTGTTDSGCPLSYNVLLLPLSTDGETVDKIFSVSFDEDSIRAIRHDPSSKSDRYLNIHPAQAGTTLPRL